MRALKWTLLIAGMLIFIVAGYYTYSIVNFANNISQGTDVNKGEGGTGTVKTDPELIPPKWEGKNRVNVLLLGGDSRGMKKNEVPRSDTLMVASIDPVTKKAHLFSILRDTYVKIPGHGEERINAAYTLGGANLAMKTVSDLLGVPIQYYVYTDFVGFIALIDAVGGIEFEVEKDMKYQDSADDHVYDINLKKGLQQMDGKTALQYVRFRHDALSDFSRTERQRNFMQAVAKKLQSTSSIFKLPKILSAIDPYIETNLSVTDMVKLGALGFEAKVDGIVSSQLPPSELLVEKNVHGAAVITSDKVKLQSFISNLFDGMTTEEALNSKPKPSGTSKATSTPKASSRPTATPKATATPRATATPKPTPKPTTTPEATSTPDSESSPKPTGTGTPTNTPKPTPTETTSPKPTATPVILTPESTPKPSTTSP